MSAIQSPAPASPSPLISASAGLSPSPDGSLGPPQGEFVNPVLDVDFPDPQVIEVDGTYYAYATQGHGFHIQLSTSDDMINWGRPAEALPRLPLWSPGQSWAPEVFRTAASFVMYYTLRAPGVQRPDGDGSQCISFATSDSAGGPFADPNSEPFICQPELGGSIDPHPFVDADGRPYLVWKNDGNCCARPTRMWIQELSDDGTQLVGEVTDMGVRNDQSWEGAVIEGPTLLLHDGTYYLFYSAGDYNSSSYSVGYATSGTLRGPYADADGGPILASADGAAGPGGQTIITDAAGELWIYYHAWDKAAVGTQRGGRRSMWLSRMQFEDGRPVIEPPVSSRQLAPTPVGR
jgi:beta-xylosidase